MPLSDIPVNATTCSELVRLCLTKQDVSDEKSDTSEDMEDAEDEVVSLILVSCLLSCSGSGSRSGSGSSPMVGIGKMSRLNAGCLPIVICITIWRR